MFFETKQIEKNKLLLAIRLLQGLATGIALPLMFNIILEEVLNFFNDYIYIILSNVYN